MEIDALILAIAALLTALGSVAGALALGAKQLAEAKATRAVAEHTARQVSPNHGSSLADAIKRVEVRQKEHSASIGGIRDDMRVLREEKVDEHDDIRKRLRDLELRKDRRHGN